MLEGQTILKALNRPALGAFMNQKKKVRLIAALAASNAKGNAPLSQALREALEENQTSQLDSKAA